MSNFSKIKQHFAASSNYTDYIEAFESAASCPTAIMAIQRGNDITAFNSSLTTVPAGAGGIYSFYKSIDNSKQTRWEGPSKNNPFILTDKFPAKTINGVSIKGGLYVYDITNQRFASATKYNGYSAKINRDEYGNDSSEYFFDFSGDLNIDGQVFRNIKANNYFVDTPIGKYNPGETTTSTIDDFIGKLNYRLLTTGQIKVFLIDPHSGHIDQ